MAEQSPPVVARTDMSRRRACDACYSMKEKCHFTSPASDCDRCRRLSKPCVTDRLVRAPGRRRLPSTTGHVEERHIVTYKRATPERVPRVLQPFSFRFSDLKPVDLYLLSQMVDPVNATELITTPRLGRLMHREAMQCLLNHFDTMSDGVFAMFGTFASMTQKVVPQLDQEVNVQRATLALSKFQALECPSHERDFHPWLWLGASLLIHSHCTLGFEAAPVRRYMLGHLDQLQGHASAFKRHPVIISLICVDIFDSLLYCQLPTTDMPADSPFGIETFIGLCFPLVRRLHDLCEISHAIHQGQDMEMALRDFEDVTDKWQPEMTPEFKTLSDVQALHLLAQARVFKVMVSLYVHRLRFAFGEEDTTAKQMASSILSELDTVTRISGIALNYVSLPFIIAAIEATNPGEREKILDDVDKYISGISPACRSLSRNFLRSLWTLRDRTRGFKWMHVMDFLPPISVNIYNLNR